MRSHGDETATLGVPGAEVLLPVGQRSVDPPAYGINRTAKAPVDVRVIEPRINAATVVVELDLGCIKAYDDSVMTTTFVVAAGCDPEPNRLGVAPIALAPAVVRVERL